MCGAAKRYCESVVQPSGNCNFPDHDFTSSKFNVLNYTAYDGAPVSIASCKERSAYMAAQNASWAAIERPVEARELGCPEFVYGIVLREPMSLMRSEATWHGINISSVIDWFAPGPDGISTKSTSCATCRRHSHMHWSPELNWQFFDNYATRMLNGRAGMEAPPGGIHDGHLRVALAHLSRFAVVLALETLSSMNASRILEERFGWTEKRRSSGGNPTIGHANAQHANVTPMGEQWELAEERGELSILRNLNAFDLKLYRNLTRGLVQQGNQSSDPSTVVSSRQSYRASETEEGPRRKSPPPAAHQYDAAACLRPSCVTAALP